MKRHHALMCVLLVLWTAQTLAAQAAAQQQSRHQSHYVVQDLGTLGGTMGFATGMNNRGWVEGVASLSGDSTFHAFLWRNGKMQDLGTLGGPNSGSSAFLAQWGPNESGQVAGPSDTTFADPFGNDLCLFGTNLICHAFLWQHGVMSDLGTLGGNNSNASAINNRGQVSGFAENIVPDATCQVPQFYQMKPVIWEKGKIKELPTWQGDPDGWAVGINDRGHAVGMTGDCSTSAESWWGAVGHHAVIWRNGTIESLGSLGGKLWNFALNINNKDQVVGYSDLPGDTTQHAFLWEHGTMKDLGALPGHDFSTATAINDNGQTVGFSRDADLNDTAVVWERDVITDLNSLVDTNSSLYLIWAISINSRGEIVGWALDTATGEIHAYLATPKNCADGHDCVAEQVEQRAVKKAVLPVQVREMLRTRQPLISGVRR